MAAASPKSQARKFQAPKGTRDFYPADLAVRRHIENVWRQVSINHGFDEIDGPTFEHLDLYTHKSGPGIASELFQVFSGKDPEQVASLKKEGGLAPYALRPEFTPTLARMVAARAPELPRPIKWFAIPSHFRAESPQRGRLREFMQWNVDFIGDDSPRADAEVIATAIAALNELGLTSKDVLVRIFDRHIAEAHGRAIGIEDAKFFDLLWILDNAEKWNDAQTEAELRSRDISQQTLRDVYRFFKRADELAAAGQPVWSIAKEIGLSESDFDHVGSVQELLDDMGLSGWHTFDTRVVRGLAYYTGTVFEIIAEGERAIAGGGRYDKLIEGFGGPPLPACGFGMGDVVLANILKDKGLLKDDEQYLPRPDAFVIAASDDAATKLPAIVADLRRQNLHARQSYKTTRNVGKLLGDAGKCRARFAVILGAELADNPPRIALKDMDSGEQRQVALSELVTALRSAHSH